MANNNANSLSGVSLTVIANEMLPVLQARLAPLGLFSTDFSADVASVGSAVSTAIPTAMTAVSFDRTVGYASQHATSSQVLVTLDKHKHYTVGFDDSEVGNIGLARLQNLFIEPAVNAIANSVQGDVLSLITTAYPAVYSSSYANFGFSGITTAAKVLDNSGSATPRAALLGTNVFYDVLDDIKGIYSAGADALRKGEVGTLGNVATALVPDSKFAGYSSTLSAGLAGFVAGKDAIAIAARLPGSLPAGAQVQNVTLSNGFTVQLRQWYSWDYGQWKISAVAIYGCSRANTSAGVRIITTD